MKTYLLGRPIGNPEIQTSSADWQIAGPVCPCSTIKEKLILEKKTHQF